jgi:hypothetical protein
MAEKKTVIRRTIPSVALSSSALKFRILVNRREEIYTIDEVTALIRSTFAGLPGISPPGRNDVISMEVDPLSAKFGHVIMYGVIMGMKIGYSTNEATMARKGKKRHFIQDDRRSLDRMMDGESTITKISVYADRVDGKDVFNLFPVENSKHIFDILKLMDLSYKESLNVITAELLDK